MALVLNRKRGESFLVGKREFRVFLILPGKKQFILESPSDKNGWLIPDEFVIEEQHATEVMPNVFVSAGLSDEAAGVQVVIDAPREIKVMRGELHGLP